MSDQIRSVFFVLGLLFLVVSSGCASFFLPSLAHTVNVYNNDYEDGEHRPHNVTVIVKNGQSEAIYNRTYRLNDNDSADETGGFPAKTKPETILVRLDGEEFTYEWPTPNCGERTHSGVEISITSEKSEPISINGICETETVKK